jgi:predicted nucleic acid-binding protein
MKPKVYLETSIISYLTGRPSKDGLVAGRQRLTRDWWEKVLPSCAPHVSPVVWAEASEGDPLQARARVASIRGMQMLEITPAVAPLSEAYYQKLGLPERARSDALHLAVATAHGIDYLLSWNCAHIASARVRIIVSIVNDRFGLRSPVICTPEELMEV